MLKSKVNSETSHILKYSLASVVFLGFASFLQPKFMLSGFILMVLYSLTLVSKRIRLKFVALSVVILMVSPTVLIIRNVVSNNLYAIATELGGTMRIGAGEKTSGGYGSPDGTIICKPKPPAAEPTDSQVVRCILKWYATHPVKTAKLVVSKSVFYWSPWSGPIANGTMARNPWLKINPIMDITKTQEGRDLVYGPFGKTVSWLWIIGQLVLLFSGLIWLWKMGGSEKLLAKLAGAPVLLGWLISTGTIGDHRFRIPQMGLSLFLQVAGFYALRKRLSVATISPALEGSTKAR
jgi:hypothetical protein